MTERCPACGSPTSVHGYVTHEQAGTYCRAPTAPAPTLRETAQGIAIVTHPPAPPKRRAIPIPPAAPKKPCASCGADIVWITTDRGRKMPVDPGTGESLLVTPVLFDARRLIIVGLTNHIGPDAFVHAIEAIGRSEPPTDERSEEGAQS